jgi:photosystem II stability/assembly factor-like uncharacterized protein
MTDGRGRAIVALRMSTLLLAGTRKGLFLLESDDGRREWTLEGPFLTGWSVHHAVLDPRDGTIHAATNNAFYGATVHRSSDRGQSWERAEELGLPEDSGLTLEATWHIEPGREGENGRLWLGAAPGVLFRSDDGGATWAVVDGLLNDPTRDRWHPGAGGMCCHSIQLDPEERERMYVGISAAGVFRSEDAGSSWTPANSGTAADFLPENYPEVGQCVHKVLLHPARPERLWQQNHCGVYRSDDRGTSWERLDGNGLPSDFGFALALDPRDPDTAFVVPEESAENRVTANGRLGAYRTGDAGASWELSAAGLPERAWVAVLREGLAFDRLDPFGVYLGTQSGSVFVSPDGGASWLEAAAQLPPVLSVEAGEWR